MTTNESALFCVICQCKDINKSAIEYCPQCEEALCGDCRDNHKISRLSKSHQTISIEKYNNLPSFVKQISHNCAEHGFVLEFFCKSHDFLCCKRCVISGHKECKEIIFIEDFLTPSSGNQSAALDSIVNVLKDLETNISSAIKDRNRNLTELREQKQLIAKQIKEKRQQINIFLDHLEGALQEQASAIEKEYCQKIEEVIAKLNEEKQKVDEIQKDVESVKSFASNLQIFMGSKSFEEHVSTNELNVHKLYEDGSLNNVTMECTFNEKLERLIKEIQIFGDMKVDNCEKHISFSWKSDKSAQFFKTVPNAISIENIRPRLVRKFNINHFNLSGCAISEAGEMFFLPLHHNNLLKYGTDGEFHAKLRINSGQYNIGYDLVVVDSDTVAVSSGGNLPYEIRLIDMNSAETRQVFYLDDFCYGLSYHNGSLIYITNKEGIYISNLINKKLTNVRKLPNTPKCLYHTYVTSNENCIFHSNHLDHSVICYNFNGQVKWKYSNSLLRKPYGITVDSYWNIYVAGYLSNNIVVISPDGRHTKEIIGASNGLLNPRAIYFDKTKNLLLVANHKEVAFLFDV